MSRGLASNSKYSYNHLNGKGASEAIDVHDITVKKSRLRIFLSYFGAAVFLTATFYLVVLKVSTNHPSGLLMADISHIILSICSFYLPIDKFQGRLYVFPLILKNDSLGRPWNNVALAVIADIFQHFCLTGIVYQLHLEHSCVFFLGQSSASQAYQER